MTDSNTDKISQDNTQDTQDDTQPSKMTETTKESDNKMDLLTVNIKDDNTALNVMVGFLGIAQKRGTFAINESAKIYECIKQFQR